MSAADNRYSVFIGWAKISLPLAALALLSTIFLFSRQGSEDNRIPFAEIAAIAGDPRITNPTFSGVAEDGSVLSLSAEELRPIPDSPDSYTIIGPRLSVITTDGTLIDVFAGTGEIDSSGRSSVLSGGVQIISSTRFTAEAPIARIDLRTGTIETDGPLTARAPFGRLDAGRLRITGDQAGRRTRLLFDGGVSLLYVPQS